MRGQWILIAGLVVLSMAAGGALTWYFREKPVPPPAAPPPAAKPATPSSASFGGKVLAAEVVPLPSPITGVMDQLLVAAGQPVMAGQLLARVNSSELEANRETTRLEMARLNERIDALEKSVPGARLEATRARTAARRSEAEFEAAKKNFERQGMLMKEGATARLSYEAAQREFEKAQTESSSLDQLADNAEERLQALLKEIESARMLSQDKSTALESTEEELRTGEIAAPIDGWVAAVNAQPGDTVNQNGTPILLLASSLATLRITVHPDAAVLRQIIPGQKVTVSIFEVPGASFPGEVKEVRESEVVVEFQNQDQIAKPGQTGDVRFTFPN